MQDRATGGVMRGPWPWVVAAAAWALGIVVFGVIPTHQALAATVGREENLVASLGHFVEYAVFAFVLAVALGGWRAGVRSLGLAAAIAVGLGWSIELVQVPLPYRDFQVSDGVTDMAGVGAGLAVFSLIVLARAARPRARRG
jgi:VanZ family protein